MKKTKKAKQQEEEEFNKKPKYNYSFSPKDYEPDESQVRRNNDFKATQNHVNKCEVNLMQDIEKTNRQMIALDTKVKGNEPTSKN